MIELIPMTEDDFQAFIAWAIPDYAQEQVRAGAWPPEKAVEMSQGQFDQLIPDGLSTADQHFRIIQETATGHTVGYLWYGLRGGPSNRSIALYEIVVLETHRRQGYGTAALQALEKEARHASIDTVLLHVFGHNQPARALYQKLGYVERNVTMAKKLAPLEL